MQKNSVMKHVRVSMLVLIVLSIICILLSAIYSSAYLAIVGASFFFWASVLLYITPSKNVPLDFLVASINYNMSNTERILSELNFFEKGIYLPPKNLKLTESSIVFIPRTQEQSLPKPDEIKTTELLNSKRDSLFLTPPGLILSQIYERKLGNSFTKIDLPMMEKLLSKIVIEDLGIMENLVVNNCENRVVFKIKGNIFKEVCHESQKFPIVHNSIGCMLSSSFACVLAKVTGKAIFIDNESESKDGKTTVIEYTVLEG